MRHPLFLAMGLLALTSLASAQSTRVVPAICANTEGNDIGTYPFGRGSFRTQQIWEGTSIASTVALISALSYRPDNDNSIGSQATLFSPITVTVSKTTVSPFAMATTFASNVTGTPATVFQGVRVFCLTQVRHRTLPGSCRSERVGCIQPTACRRSAAPRAATRQAAALMKTGPQAP